MVFFFIPPKKKKEKFKELVLEIEPITIFDKEIKKEKTDKEESKIVIIEIL